MQIPFTRRGSSNLLLQYFTQLHYTALHAYFSGSPMRGSLTLVVWNSLGACSATIRAATWEQAEFVLDPLMQLQLWVTTRDILGPRLRWLVGFSPTARMTVTSW